MPNDYFEFKKFTVRQSRCSQKVSTDACIFGAWVANTSQKFERAIDIGAGTGLLMLMIAQKHEANIDGVEIEQECALQLEENLEASPWAERLHAIQADARTFSYESRYDLVMSNPPFYENQLTSPTASKNLAWHSEELNLSALVQTASAILTPGGNFYVILPYSRKYEALETAAQYQLYPVQTLGIQHTQDHPLSRSLIRFSRQQVSQKEDLMAIRNEAGAYTSAFIELMSDYYLFL